MAFTPPSNPVAKTWTRHVTSPELDGNFPNGNRPGGGTPVITSATVSGSTLTINGSGFGTKANAKPLLWWKADLGINPSSLGRTLTWLHLSTFTELSSAIFAPNSTQAARHDHSATSNAILGAIRTTTGRFYQFRRTYEDFNVQANQGPSGFNFKTSRIHNSAPGQGNNIFRSVQGSETNQFVISAEWTDATYGTADIQMPQVWKREELIYSDSDVDVSNGIYNFIVNGVLSYGEPNQSPGTKRFITQGTLHDPSLYLGPCDEIWQGQVSNGAGAGSWNYYDCIYIDDSWHRVILSTSPTKAGITDAEPQIIATYSDTQTTAYVNLGALGGSEIGKYVYVYDGNGNANDNGVQVVAA